MRTVQVTQRIGEWSDLDPDYDGRHIRHLNPEEHQRCMGYIKSIAKNPQDFEIWRDTGAIFEIVYAGMYDGWPFWAPVPAVGYVGPLGAVEECFYYNLGPNSLHRRLKEKSRKQ